MKTLVKIFSTLVLALGIFSIVPATEAHAVVTAPPLSYFKITGMSEDAQGDFFVFPDNKVETDGTIYIKVHQLGYGNVSIKVNGVNRNFQEVNSEAITQLSPKYGKIVIGWDNTYRIDNLSDGINNVEFMCIGTSSSTVLKDTATINKLRPGQY